MAKRILIIDDDVELCEEVAEFFSSEGFCVETAFDSQNGENLINKNKYDVVMLDFKVPGLNGIQMLKKIKAKDEKASVFLITGRPFVEKLLEEEEAKDLVAGFMNKPFDIELLLEKVRRL